MKLTKNYRLKKPEPSDFIDVEADFHETLDTVDAELKKHADALAGVSRCPQLLGRQLSRTRRR